MTDIEIPQIVVIIFVSFCLGNNFYIITILLPILFTSKHLILGHPKDLLKEVTKKYQLPCMIDSTAVITAYLSAKIYNIVLIALVSGMSLLT